MKLSIDGIKDKTCQNNTGGKKHLVTVGVCAAVHAGSVVHDDTAHHGAFDGSWVRSELPPERG